MPFYRAYLENTTEGTRKFLAEYQGVDEEETLDLAEADWHAEIDKLVERGIEWYVSLDEVETDNSMTMKLVIPQGWALIPTTPTQEMRDALADYADELAYKNWKNHGVVFELESQVDDAIKKMISAAPTFRRGT